MLLFCTAAAVSAGLILPPLWPQLHRCCVLHWKGSQSARKGATQPLAAQPLASLLHTQCSHCCDAADCLQANRPAQEQALAARSPLLCHLPSCDHVNCLLCVQNKVSMSLMGTLTSAVLGRAYQVYYSATLTKQRIQDEMTRRLYEKTVRLAVSCEHCAGHFWRRH